MNAACKQIHTILSINDVTVDFATNNTVSLYGYFYHAKKKKKLISA
jgi:hypothetical protein